MKIKTDFVTNSSSTSFIIIRSKGKKMKMLIHKIKMFLFELIQWRQRRKLKKDGINYG